MDLAQVQCVLSQCHGVVRCYLNAFRGPLVYQLGTGAANLPYRVNFLYCFDFGYTAIFRKHPRGVFYGHVKHVILM